MKAVLISIQPKWVEKIANGKKTVEVRRTKPKIDVPFKCYIYCTKGDWLTSVNGKVQKPNNMVLDLVLDNEIKELNGKVIGEFVCDRIDRIEKRGIHHNFDYCYLSLNEFGNDDIEIEIRDIQKSCIPKEKLNSYGAHSSRLFAWHISDLVIYDRPKDLGNFYHECKGVCVDTKKKIKCERIMVDGFSCNGRLPITRPPQSWCYCEELKGETE